MCCLWPAVPMWRAQHRTKVARVCVQKNKRERCCAVREREKRIIEYKPAARMTCVVSHRRSTVACLLFVIVICVYCAMCMRSDCVYMYRERPLSVYCAYRQLTSFCFDNVRMPTTFG